jgi:hypothetical protein
MSIVPKALKKLAIRTVICLFIIAAILAAYQWMKGHQDLGNLSNAKTSEMILAIKSSDNGAQAVIVKPDGTIWDSPEYVDEATDRDPTWRPDGSIAFFSSDRKKESYNIYRWNLQFNVVEQRSTGTRSQLATNFGSASLGADNNAALITAGGFVLQYNPEEPSTQQVLPPVGRDASASSEEGGVGSQFEAIYQRIGNSFKEARWGKDKRFIVATMRGDEGETLIVQPMVDAKPPMIVASGDRIDFDIDPQNGMVVFAIINYRISNIENMFQIRNGDAGRSNGVTDPKKIAANRLKLIKADLKIRHRLAYFDPEQVGNETINIIAISEKDSECFANPRVSPDGSLLMVSTGEYEGNSNVSVKQLDLMPLMANAYKGKTLLVQGVVSDPSWHPSGNKIVFVQKDNQNMRSIFTISKDGSNLVNLTKGKGNYSRPTFSPQSR